MAGSAGSKREQKQHRGGYYMPDFRHRFRKYNWFSDAQASAYMWPRSNTNENHVLNIPIQGHD
jgi:hypothetical protein